MNTSTNKEIIQDHQKMISKYLGALGVLAMLTVLVALIAFPIWLSNQPDVMKEPFAALVALLIAAMGFGGIAAYAFESVRDKKSK